MCEKLLFTLFLLFICLDALFMALVFKTKEEKKKLKTRKPVKTWT